MAKATTKPAAKPGGKKTARSAAADETPDVTVEDVVDSAAAAETKTEDLSSLSAQQLIDRLTQADALADETQDGLLRARAETENIRRRSQNEIVSARKFAIEGFAQELLGVRDSLERAAAANGELDATTATADPIRQMQAGVALTLKQFDLALAKFAVVEVEAAPGVRFDPEQHQAISMLASAEVAAGHIISVVQKGFALKERLLRPAMVVVAGET